MLAAVDPRDSQKDNETANPRRSQLKIYTPSDFPTVSSTADEHTLTRAAPAIYFQRVVKSGNKR